MNTLAILEADTTDTVDTEFSDTVQKYEKAEDVVVVVAAPPAVLTEVLTPEADVIELLLQLGTTAEATTLHAAFRRIFT